MVIGVDLTEMGFIVDLFEGDVLEVGWDDLPRVQVLSASMGALAWS